MYSFYGGKAGLSYKIVATFSSIQEMAKAFARGASYSDVQYGEYVLIDTEDKASLENGCIYERGYRYDSGTPKDPGEPPFSDKSAYLTYNEKGQAIFDEDRYLKDIKDKTTKKQAYIKSLHGGAIYVGRIVGSTGATPSINLMSESALKTYATEHNETTIVSNISSDVVSGDRQKYASYSFVNVKDSNNNIFGCYIAFTIPYTSFHLESNSVSPYVDNGDMVATYADGKWSYNNMVTKTSGNDDETPYSVTWNMKIPRGIHGMDITSIGIDEQTKQYYYTVRDYTLGDGLEGAPAPKVTTNYLENSFFRVIQNITFDEQASEYTIHYTSGEDDIIKMKTIRKMEFNNKTYDDSQTLIITYSDETTETISKPINALVKYDIYPINTERHLIVFYSDPERRGKIPEDKRIVYSDPDIVAAVNNYWEDLGNIRGPQGIVGGTHIYGNFDNEEALRATFPNGLEDPEAGWICTVGAPDNCYLYAFDYTKDTNGNYKGWYIAGAINDQLIKPNSVMIAAKKDVELDRPENNLGQPLVDKGFWLVIEE